MHMLATLGGFGSLLSPARPKNLKIVLFIPALLFAAIGYAHTTIPDTPAGKALRAWLDAFNRGARAKVEEYVKTFAPEQSIERMMAFYNRPGGLDLTALETSEHMRIE